MRRTKPSKSEPGAAVTQIKKTGVRNHPYSRFLYVPCVSVPGAEHGPVPNVVVVAAAGGGEAGVAAAFPNGAGVAVLFQRVHGSQQGGLEVGVAKGFFAGAQSAP